MLLLLDTLFLGFLMSLLLREQIFYFLKISLEMWKSQKKVLKKAASNLLIYSVERQRLKLDN